MQIQGLVNLLTGLYGLKLSNTSEKDRNIRVAHCGEKLGFFEKGTVPAVKDNIKAHVEKWLPGHLRSSFITYISMLEGLLSPAVNQEEVVRKNYKITKCALVNGNFFSPYAGATLEQVIRKVVCLEVERIAAKKAKKYS